MAVTGALPSRTKIEAKSTHVSDNNIQPFLQPEFDPVHYLNSTLPSLSLSSTTRGTPNARSVPISELSLQLQTLLTQLNAQATRLSNALAQLTDEIIRSGGRLAYEVEVLRGETLGLTDSVENELKGDIERFVPRGEDGAMVTPNSSPEKGMETTQTSEPSSNTEPVYLEKLRTLTAVRARLDSVVKTFGEAMQWPLAPSDLSLTSSLISVSAPDTSSGNDDARSREEKGQAYTEALRMEISELLGSSNDGSGVEAASTRVEVLRQLSGVWKGTAEEKARLRIVDVLAKLVEDRQKALERSGAVRKQGVSPARGMDYRYGDLGASRAAGEGGYGFLQNLRNLKNDMYLE